MSDKTKVAAEVAEQEFNRLCDHIDVDTDLSDMDEEDRASFDQHKRTLVRAIQLGRLRVEDSGLPVYTTFGGEDLPFIEPTGGVLLNGGKKDSDTKKMYMMISELTSGKAQCGKLPMKDVKVLLAVAALFLAS